MRPEDSDFIAHSRTDIPALLSLLDRARDTLKEIDEYFDKSPWRYQGKKVDLVKAMLRDLEVG